MRPFVLHHLGAELMPATQAGVCNLLVMTLSGQQPDPPHPWNQAEEKITTQFVSLLDMLSTQCVENDNEARMSSLTWFWRLSRRNT